MLFLGLILICFAFWFFSCKNRYPEQSGSERAKNILAERYARGEISSEEYRERVAQI